VVNHDIVIGAHRGHFLDFRARGRRTIEARLTARAAPSSGGRRAA
jgi:hypothetical protein